ncbi:MAG: hypothetical protein ACKV2V_03610 [Blastocatellia bacterium]
MWKQIGELFTSVLTLVHRLDQLEQSHREQQREIRDLTALVNRIAFELGRTNDEIRRGAEREAAAREKFMRQVENQLLRSGRQIPPQSEE